MSRKEKKKVESVSQTHLINLMPFFQIIKVALWEFMIGKLIRPSNFHRTIRIYLVHGIFLQPMNVIYCQSSVHVYESQGNQELNAMIASATYFYKQKLTRWNHTGTDTLYCLCDTPGDRRKETSFSEM